MKQITHFVYSAVLAVSSPLSIHDVHVHTKQLPANVWRGKGRVYNNIEPYGNIRLEVWICDDSSIGIVIESLDSDN